MTETWISFSFEYNLHNILCHCLRTRHQIPSVSIAWVTPNISLLRADQSQQSQKNHHLFILITIYIRTVLQLIGDRLCGNTCLALTSVGLMGKTEPAYTSIGSRCSANLTIIHGSYKQCPSSWKERRHSTLRTSFSQTEHLVFKQWCDSGENLKWKMFDFWQKRALHTNCTQEAHSLFARDFFIDVVLSRNQKQQHIVTRLWAKVNMSNESKSEPVVKLTLGTCSH